MFKNLKLRTMKNLKAVRLRNGCEFECHRVIEGYRFSRDEQKITSIKLKAFVLADGDTFDIKAIESVLWVDLSNKHKREYFIDTESYAEDFYLEKPISVEEYFKN